MKSRLIILVLILWAFSIALAEFQDGKSNTSVNSQIDEAISGVTDAYIAADTVVSNGAVAGYQAADTVISTNVVTLSGGGEINGDLTLTTGSGLKFKIDADDYVYVTSSVSTQLVMQFTVSGVESNTYFNKDSD